MGNKKSIFLNGKTARRSTRETGYLMSRSFFTLYFQSSNRPQKLFIHYLCLHGQDQMILRFFQSSDLLLAQDPNLLIPLKNDTIQMPCDANPIPGWKLPSSSYMMEASIIHGISPSPVNRVTSGLNGSLLLSLEITHV